MCMCVGGWMGAGGWVHPDKLADEFKWFVFIVVVLVGV